MAAELLGAEETALLRVVAPGRPPPTPNEPDAAADAAWCRRLATERGAVVVHAAAAAEQRRAPLQAELDGLERDAGEHEASILAHKHVFDVRRSKEAAR